jgi:hypothetical protein
MTQDLLVLLKTGTSQRHQQTNQHGGLPRDGLWVVPPQDLPLCDCPSVTPPQQANPNVSKYDYSDAHHRMAHKAETAS